MTSHRLSFPLVALSGVLVLGSIFAGELPRDTSDLFSGSGNCTSCHEASSGDALRTTDGNDVSPVTLWRSTMMANAAKDPLWQAKVTTEVVDNPALKEVIEDKCVTCHAPMARTEAIYDGASYYSLQEAQADPLGLDGVSCTLCHQIKPENLGTSESFSGEFTILDDRLIYGPYDDETWSSMMQASVNYSFAFGGHLRQSELCATCHTLFTPTVDNAGQIVGEIPEQTPYLEWKNSVYPSQQIHCQTCHVPAASEAVAISTVPTTLAQRSPFGQHFFVGGNVTILEMMKDNAAQIGATADESHFDSTIARTKRQLASAIDLEATFQWLPGDTLEIVLSVSNETGHKFPTGFPSRRAWLHTMLRTASGDLVFESGGWNEDTGEIIGLDEPYEPHHNVIKSADQVQVYQSLMADVDGNLTWKLLRGSSYLKDNRIPPEGFTKSGPHYDSTAIVGLADVDQDFNNELGVEGTGGDVVSYRIGGLSRSVTYVLESEMLYQSVSPSFANDLLTYMTPEVQTFSGFYSKSDKSPQLISTLGLTISATSSDRPVEIPASLEIKGVYPSPSSGALTIEFEMVRFDRVIVTVIDLLGRMVKTVAEEDFAAGSHTVGLDLSDLPSGVYLLRVDASSVGMTRTFVLAR